MKKVVEVKGLSKKYPLRHDQHGSYQTLVEECAEKIRCGLQRLRHPFRCSEKKTVTEDFWALKDIDLSIEEGDRVGIIGRNGAGKSTLLKLLSRITFPTTGRISIRGKVSSLLEVGTGFHPELTGRENIFLNGAILGMKREEIRAKFDEIVAFAEVAPFLDTPVKRFSSGMFTRLGFAIAAHLDPDLFIVDEVLAVGDVGFQEKCIKKLNDLGASGRTVIFVSHDIGSVLSLCNRGVYLEKGELRLEGSMESCVNAYVSSTRLQTLEWKGEIGDEHIRFYCASLRGEQPYREFFYQNENPVFEIEYEVLKPSPDLVIGIGVWNQRNQRLGRSHTFDDIQRFSQFSQPGKHRISFALDGSMFLEGDYLVRLECFIHNKKCIVNDEISLKMPIYALEKNTRFGHLGSREGIFLGNKWQIHSEVCNG